MTSRKMMSGRCSTTFASAPKPSSARITSHLAWPRKICALRRIVVLSSITSTLSPEISLLSNVFPLREPCCSTTSRSLKSEGFSRRTETVRGNRQKTCAWARRNQKLVVKRAIRGDRPRQALPGAQSPASGGGNHAAPCSIDPHLLGVDAQIEATRIDQHFSEHLIGFFAVMQALEQEPAAASGFQADIDLGELTIFLQRLIEAAEALERARVEQAHFIGTVTGVDARQPLQHLARLLVGLIVDVRARQPHEQLRVVRVDAAQ